MLRTSLGMEVESTPNILQETYMGGMGREERERRENGEIEMIECDRGRRSMNTLII